MREQLLDAIVDTMAETHPRFGFRAGYDPLNDCYFLLVIKVTPRFEIRSCINVTEILDKHHHDNGEFDKAVCAEVNTSIESIEREERNA
jgi:hypothetical protein